MTLLPDGLEYASLFPMGRLEQYATPWASFAGQMVAVLANAKPVTSDTRSIYGGVGPTMPTIPTAMVAASPTQKGPPCVPNGDVDQRVMAKRSFKRHRQKPDVIRQAL
jgi:hypothetical protein